METIEPNRKKDAGIGLGFRCFVIDVFVAGRRVSQKIARLAAGHQYAFSLRV